ncbi:hypothetical protein GRX66_19040, partial [Halobacterium sp. PCN9]|nr:hypothetical protein [Halobacterium bonnevillei]
MESLCEDHQTMHESQSPVRALLDEFVRPRRRKFAAGIALLAAAVFVQRVPALVVGV